MKKQKGFIALCWILAAIAASSAQTQPAAAAGPDISIAVEGNFPPFNYLDANGDLQGFDVEIAKALCDAMQRRCDFVIQPWEEMIPGLLDSDYDAVVSSMSMSAERRELVAFSARYYDSPSVFITGRTSELRIFDAEGMEAHRLGVTLSTAQEAYAEHFYAHVPIVVFGSSPELYEGLAEGEVDVILEDKLAAYDWLTNTKAGGCCEFRGKDIKDPTYFGDGAGIAVRKDDAALLQDLDAALVTITQDGTYDMINAKYFPFPIR
jgi:polar amino acid transport system substrate-binding protein